MIGKNLEVSILEKSIQKWAIYGFFISLALSILLVDYKETYDFDGGYSTVYVPVYDYIVSIIRYSVIGAFAGVIVGWGFGRRIYEDKK